MSRAPILASLAAALVVAAAATGGGLSACGDDAGSDPISGAGDASDERAPPDAQAAPADALAPVDAAPTRADFGLDVRPSNTTCKAPARPPNAAPVVMQRVFANVSFSSLPLSMRQIPGDKSRWFVALRDGRIVSFPTVNPPNDPTIVADLAALSGMPVGSDVEGGLLGLAFHPSFAQNGQLFVSWTTDGLNNSGIRSIVSRLTSTNNGATFGQHTAIVGPFDQPHAPHKGGSIAFGPEGLLYLGFGDGGSVDNGQPTTSFLSKILRIDVDSPPPGKTYGIPAGNPFAAGGGEPATFARGFRNPFRFSFDRATGDLWVGDVGEGAVEEIDVVKVGGNYGWPCREGLTERYPEQCTGNETLIEPVYSYEHTAAPAAVTGGVVYRGSAIPGLAGTYIFGDSSLGEVYSLAFDPTTGAPTRTTLDAGGAAYWVDFAEDADGEVYGVDLFGSLYKLVAAQPAPASSFPDRLSKTGCVDPVDPRKPASGLIPYDVSSPLWSDGADKERFLALPNGTTMSIGADGDLALPTGSVLLKTFSVAGKRIESRLFVRHDDGEWAGYSYEWNDTQTDATLLPSSKSKKVGAQTWSFPSRSACSFCHSAAAGRTLGLELGQLNGDFVYAQTNRISNQLQTFEHIGLFEAPLGKPVGQIVAYPKPSGAGPAAPRARAYLHANCSGCHRPGGPGRGGFDLRFATPLADTKTCGVTPLLGNTGVAGAKLLVPGSPAMSLLSLRPHALGAIRMPPVASNVVDSVGLAVVDDFIRATAACP